MYEVTPGWEEYYEEMDKEDRIEIFERLIEELPDDGLNAFRKEVHETRYPKQGKRGPQMDMFLLSMVYFPGMYGKKAFVFGGSVKEINKSCKDMGLDKTPNLSDAEKNILYWEIHNAADLYFSTCRDAGYGRKIFGIVAATDEERMDQACRDAWILSRGIPKAGDKVEEMQVFSDAVIDAYFHFEKKAEKRFVKFEEEMKIKMSQKKKGWFGK